MTFPRWCAHGLGSPWNLREVAEGLYVGSVADTRHPEWIGVPHVYCLSLLERWESTRYVARVTHDLEPTADVMDVTNVPIPDGETVPQCALMACVGIVRAWRESGRTPVLIHCYAGVSRSASVAYAVLRIDGLSDEEALARVSVAGRGPSPWALDTARAWVVSR